MNFILLPLLISPVRGVLPQTGFHSCQCCHGWGRVLILYLCCCGGFLLNRDLGFAARACPPYLSLKSFWQRDQCQVLQAQMEEFTTGSETSTITVSAANPPLLVWHCLTLRDGLILESHPPSSCSCPWVWKCSSETFFWRSLFQIVLALVAWEGNTSLIATDNF